MPKLPSNPLSTAAASVNHVAYPSAAGMLSAIRYQAELEHESMQLAMILVNGQLKTAFEEVERREGLFQQVRVTSASTNHEPLRLAAIRSVKNDAIAGRFS